MAFAAATARLKIVEKANAGMTETSYAMKGVDYLFLYL